MRATAPSTINTGPPPAAQQRRTPLPPRHPRRTARRKARSPPPPGIPTGHRHPPPAKAMSGRHDRPRLTSVVHTDTGFHPLHPLEGGCFVRCFHARRGVSETACADRVLQGASPRIPAGRRGAHRRARCHTVCSALSGSGASSRGDLTRTSSDGCRAGGEASRGWCASQSPSRRMDEERAAIRDGTQREKRACVAEATLGRPEA